MLLPTALLVLFGCADKSIALGVTPDPDARFIADLSTWECSASDTGGGGERTWEGVRSYRLTLEIAPDTLVDRNLPSGTCVKGLDLFPTDAGAAAVDVDGAPAWSNGDLSGRLTASGTGFWQADAFANQDSCMTTDELLGDGTLLDGIYPFSGARTPAPGSFVDATISSFDATRGLDFGASATATWDAEGWDASWVQVRREKDGMLLESVTCDTTGANAFTLDDDVWGQFNGAVEADVNNLYVGVQRSAVLDAADDQRVEVITRATHVAVLRD